MAVAVYSVLVGCGHAPPPAPKPAERQVQAVADIVGKWSASDDMDFTYALAIDDKGAFDLWIDRNKMGKCEIKGAAHAVGDKLLLSNLEDTCHRDVRQPDYELVFTQFTGDAFVLTIDEDSHAFHRAQ